MRWFSFFVFSNIVGTEEKHTAASALRPAYIYMKQTSKSQRYFLNAILLSAVTVGLRAIGVSFNAFVAQKIGSQALGLFTLVMSVYSLAITLAVSGVNLAAVRMTSERLAQCEQNGLCGKALRRALREELAGCIGYSLFFGLFAGILLFTLSGILGTYVLGDVRTIPSLQLLSIGLVPISLSSALAGYFTGLRKVYKNAAISICEQFVQIAERKRISAKERYDQNRLRRRNAGNRRNVGQKRKDALPRRNRTLRRKSGRGYRQAHDAERNVYGRILRAPAAP